MSSIKKKNIGHSVFQRLLDQAKTRGEDFNLLLSRYAIERFLYRISISSAYAEKFILKGASLFLVWQGQSYRVTKDADLLGFGPADTGKITEMFKELCNIASEDIDGMVFKATTVKAESIREEQSYGGIRVTLIGGLYQAQIPLQIDIGFGDAITPAPEKIKFPTILEAPAPQLLAYPRETMIAEKLEAMVHLGIANSRMKDFYDLWLISKLAEFDGQILSQAIENTFNRRSTPIPASVPLAFTDEFRKDEQKQTQWRAFIKKSKPQTAENNLDAIIAEIAAFLLPVLEALRNKKRHKAFWPRGGPWH